jgi:hypothetical protein
VLHWLLAQNCPFDPCEICKAVLVQACERFYGTLHKVDAAAFYCWFLIDQGFPVPAALLSQLLNEAGAHGQLAAAQALRDAGAAWPSELGCDSIKLQDRINNSFFGFNTPAVWSARELEWSRAAGCTAPLRAIPPEYLAIERVEVEIVQITRVRGMYQS